MRKVCEVTELSLVRSPQANPQINEWAICYRGDGSFSQQIVIQLPSEGALKNVIMHVNGSGVIVGGRSLSIEVSCIHPAACDAGMSAGNFVLGREGGHCL